MNRTRGIVCILASAFGFALMAACVRLCDDFGAPLSCFQKGFFRNAVAFALALGAFVCARSKGAAPSSAMPSGARTWTLVLLRALFGTVGIFANFYALSRIPIGEAMTLNKTAPFFTVLGAWLFLRERVSLRQAFALLLAFAGVVLVMRPGFAAVEPTLAALTGGLGAGLAYVCLHALGRRGVNGAFIVLFFSASSCFASLPLMAPDYRPMSVAQILILLGAGAGAAIGQFGITAAYRYAEPRSIAVFDHANVVFTALFGFVLFGQVPHPLAFAGFAAIVAAAMIMRR